MSLIFLLPGSELMLQYVIIVMGLPATVHHYDVLATWTARSTPVVCYWSWCNCVRPFNRTGTCWNVITVYPTAGHWMVRIFRKIKKPFRLLSHPTGTQSSGFVTAKVQARARHVKRGLGIGENRGRSTNPLVTGPMECHRTDNACNREFIFQRKHKSAQLESAGAKNSIWICRSTNSRCLSMVNGSTLATKCKKKWMSPHVCPMHKWCQCFLCQEHAEKSKFVSLSVQWKTMKKKPSSEQLSFLRHLRTALTWSEHTTDLQNIPKMIKLDNASIYSCL